MNSFCKLNITNTKTNITISPLYSLSHYMRWMGSNYYSFNSTKIANMIKFFEPFNRLPLLATNIIHGEIFVMFHFIGLW